MQMLRYAIVLLVGIAAGWLLRGQAESEPKTRVDRRDTPVARATVPPPPVQAPEPARDPAANETPPPEALEPGPAEETGAEDAEAGDPLAEMVKSQAPQWRAWAAMQAKQKVGGLFDGLGLDAATQKLIEEALVKEAERQADLAILMMLGEEEMDPDAFAYFMGVPENLSPELEGQLATFLHDDELAAVRGRVKEAHTKQMRDLADMQISMTGIADLSEDQKTRMREVFVGKDIMTEQFTQFAEVTRDRGRLRRLIEGKEDFGAEMAKGFEPTRRRMRDILNDEQFSRYEKYEQQMVKQAEMGMKMMASMLKSKPGTKTPAGK